jgi:hypothetical protein
MHIYFTGGRPKNLPVFEQAEKAVQKRVHLFRKDLNRIAQNDLKLHNALERLTKFNLSKALCNLRSFWAILFRSLLNNVNDKN